MATLNCTLCSDQFDSSSDSVMLRNCRHVFHSCVKDWLRSNGTCPLCRSQAGPETADQVFFSAVEVEQSQATGSTEAPLSDETLSQLMKALDLEEKEKAAALQQLRAASSRNQALNDELQKMRNRGVAVPEVKTQQQQQQPSAPRAGSSSQPPKQSTAPSPRSGPTAPVAKAHLERIVKDSDELSSTFGNMF